MPKDTIILPRHPAGATYTDYIFMTIPLYGFSVYMYGFRVLMLALLAIITANLADRAISAIRRMQRDKTEISSIAFALIVTLMLPANISYYIAVATVLFTVLIGKAAFGGYGFYVFSPVAVGFCISAISWPVQIFSYVQNNSTLVLFQPIVAQLSPGVLTVLKAGGRPALSNLDLLLGNYPSPIGTSAFLVLIACAAFLWMKKRITLYLPLIYISVCALIAFLFPRIGGFSNSWSIESMTLRLSSVYFELLGGIIIFAAIFLLNDDVLLPKRLDARIIYGILFGIFTMLFRYFGFYDIGTCFALICTNVFSLALDKLMSHLFSRTFKQRIKMKPTAPNSLEGKK